MLIWMMYTYSFSLFHFMILYLKESRRGIRRTKKFWMLCNIMLTLGTFYVYIYIYVYIPSTSISTQNEKGKSLHLYVYHKKNKNWLNRTAWHGRPTFQVSNVHVLYWYRTETLGIVQNRQSSFVVNIKRNLHICSERKM